MTFSNYASNIGWLNGKKSRRNWRKRSNSGKSSVFGCSQVVYRSSLRFFQSFFQILSRNNKDYRPKFGCRSKLYDATVKDVRTVEAYLCILLTTSWWISNTVLCFCIQEDVGSVQFLIKINIRHVLCKMKFGLFLMRIFEQDI